MQSISIRNMTTWRALGLGPQSADLLDAPTHSVQNAWVDVYIAYGRELLYQYIRRLVSSTLTLSLLMLYIYIYMEQLVNDMIYIYLIPHSVNTRWQQYITHSIDTRWRQYITRSVDTRWQQYITHSVDTRWRQYITHLHTNSTHNTVCSGLYCLGLCKYSV
jgi:hypothetical protein